MTRRQKSLKFNGKRLTKKWVLENCFDGKSAAGIPEKWITVNGKTILVDISETENVMVYDYYTGKDNIILY